MLATGSKKIDTVAAELVPRNALCRFAAATGRHSPG